MRIKLSRRVLRWISSAILFIAILAGLYLLGDHLTPRTAADRPVILSPSVQAAERYRHQVRGWIDEMAEIDRRLAAILQMEDLTDPVQLYDVSDEAQRVVTLSSDLAADVAFSSVPAALIGLAEETEVTAIAHLDAALTVAQWTGAPSPETLRVALEALRQARALRESLEASRWVE